MNGGSMNQSFMNVRHLIRRTLILVALPLLVGRAQVNPPSQLTIDHELFTRESIVEVGGKKYRKIEFRSEIFHLQLLENEASLTNLEILCGVEGASSMNSGAPPQVVASIKVTKRSSLFIQGLKQACVEKRGGKQIIMTPAIQIGFLLHDDPGSKSVLKNKRVFLTPGPSVGFSADW